MELTLNQILGSVSAQTTVPVELLLESEEFIEILKSGEFTYGGLLDWVNENF